MSKLSNLDKQNIIIQYATGAKPTVLAKKYGVSRTAISKILNAKKASQKVSEVSDKVSKSLQEKAHDAIRKIIDELPKDLSKAQLRDKLSALEKLTDLFGLPVNVDEDVTEIVVKIEDGSK